jgi:DNA modification methylase
MCGDSTSIDAVEKLMLGEKAEMMFTDPPYGVNYEGGHFNKKDSKKLKNDDSAKIYNDFLPVALSFVDGPCYMWFAGSKARDVYNSLHDNECEVHALIIWHKTNATYAAMNAQYKQRHEPCIYFKPKGSTLRWCGASTESTLWNQERDGINEFHPTQKPIALAVKAIENHKAQTVVDFFGGSGSTLMACEKTGRSARVMEFEPKYIDVIIARWQDFTGQKAIHESGKTFDEVKGSRAQ